MAEDASASVALMAATTSSATLTFKEGYEGTPYTVEDSNGRNGSGYLDGVTISSDSLSGNLTYDSWEKLKTTKSAEFGTNDSNKLKVIFKDKNAKKTGQFDSTDPGVTSLAGDSGTFTFLTGN